MSRRSCRGSNLATPLPPSNFCRWSMTSCGKLAAQRLAQEKPGQTLQATALVHEAYLRLVDGERSPALEQPRPFLCAPRPRPCGGFWSNEPATRSDSKHGGDRQRIDLDEAAIVPTPSRTNLSGARRSFGKLASRNARRRPELVKLRFFAGLTIEEAGRHARHPAAHRRSPLGLCSGLASSVCSSSAASNPSRPQKTSRIS